MICIDALSWTLPIHEQKAYMSVIQSLTDQDVDMLILPPGKQDCWENCAILLSELLDDTRLIAFLPHMLEWYKDLNWPGIEVVGTRIKKIPAFQLSVAIQVALDKAKIEGDEEWYENLIDSFFVINH